MEGDCFSKMATDLGIGCCVVVNLLISPNVDVMSFMLNSTTHVRILHTLDVAYFIFDAPVNNFFKLLADAYSITAAADLVYFKPATPIHVDARKTSKISSLDLL